MSNISTLISYVENDQGQIHLAWPCKLYKVIVPVEQKTAINLFEETILALIAENLVETKQLSDYVGLPIEFVRFVKERLMHINLIDKRLQLTEKGKKAISLMSEKISIGREESLNIYVDLISGQALDLVSVGAVRNKSFIHNENHKIELSIGTAGKIKAIQATTLKYESAYLKKNIKPTEIQKTFKKFQKRQKTLNFQSDEQQDLNIELLPTSFSQISHISEGEMVYLHCLASLDTYTNRIVVSDGLGYSRLLSNHLPKESEHRIKKRFLNQKVVSAPKLSKEKSFIKSNIEKIFRLKGELDSLLGQTKSTNIDTATTNKSYELSKLLYDTLEHIFYEIDRQFIYDGWHAIIGKDPQINSQDITDYASKLGLKISDEIQKELFYITYGQIHAIDYGTMVFKPLLAKGLIASHLFNDHPMRRIAFENSNTLEVIRQLHKLRNKNAHAEFLTKINQENFQIWYEDILKIICVVYPQVQNMNHIQNKVSLTEVSQQNLRAELRLEQYFHNSLPNLIYSKLLRLFKLPMYPQQIEGREVEIVEESRRHDYFVYLSTSLEATISYALKNLSIDINQLNNIEQLNQEMQQALLNGKPTPRVITKVKVHKLKYIMMDAKGVLLQLISSFLVVLYRQYPDIFEEIKEQAPNILQNCAQLHELRGHGNAVTENLLNLSVKEILELQQSIFKLIELIIDVTP